MYHFVPPRLLINVLDRRNGFENGRVIDEDVSMTVRFFYFLEKRSHRCWVGNIGRNNEGLDVRIRFCDAVGDFLELVNIASYENNCFCASGGERGDKCLGRLLVATRDVHGDSYSSS
jgi:hypothetical protein